MKMTNKLMKICWRRWRCWFNKNLEEREYG